MGALAIAKVDWARYAKWLMPLLGCQIAMSFATLTILQAIGWPRLIKGRKPETTVSGVSWKKILYFSRKI